MVEDGLGILGFGFGVFDFGVFNLDFNFGVFDFGFHLLTHFFLASLPAPTPT
jgi:hypothetical protein